MNSLIIFSFNFIKRILLIIYKSKKGKRINEIFITNNKLPSVDIILKYESDYPNWYSIDK